MTQLAFELDEPTTVPGYVHGIVSIDPPQIRCDGCGHTPTGPNLNMLVLTCVIEFYPMSHDKRRLCRECSKARGTGS